MPEKATAEPRRSLEAAFPGKVTVASHENLSPLNHKKFTPSQKKLLPKQEKSMLRRGKSPPSQKRAREPGKVAAEPRKVDARRKDVVPNHEKTLFSVHEKTGCAVVENFMFKQCKSSSTYSLISGITFE